MCGRYRLSRRKQMIEEYFSSVSGEDNWAPRYNIAPTQPVPIIRQNPKEPVRELSLVRWGLIPSWAKDSSAAASMINARSETASTKPTFRDALKLRRCLIPADLDNTYKGSHLLTMPLTLAPIRLDAGRNTGPSRFRYPFLGRRDRNAIPRRVLPMGWQVRSGGARRTITHATSCRTHS